jgi:regulator of protease activity HflC (stomatin/prohibitin superfamily)
MNKPITSKKFASDLWGVVQMAIEEAVLAEREACAQLLESRKTGANELMDAVRDMEARAIRARGEKQ